MPHVTVINSTEPMQHTVSKYRRCSTDNNNIQALHTILSQFNTFWQENLKVQRPQNNQC